MDDLFELILDIFESIFKGIINSRSVPKIIKYIFIILFFGFLTWMFMTTGAITPILWLKILGFALGGLFIILGLRMLIKVYRS